MKWLILLSLALLLGGLGLASYAQTIPFYTDPTAPERLAEKLLKEVDQTDQWHRQIKLYETPHRTLSDLGRGMAGAGAGLCIALLFYALYVRYSLFRSRTVIFCFWVGLWLIRFPFIFYDYNLQNQGQYSPPWEWEGFEAPWKAMGMIFLSIISSILIGLLYIRHPLPANISKPVPVTAWGNARMVILSFWLFLNAAAFVAGVEEGAAGATITCVPATLILLLLLSAKEIPKAAAPCHGMV